jgi:membrane-bound serine protease (ClpP class)
MFVTSYGFLFALGIGFFLLGGTMVFDAPEVSDLNVDFWSVLLPSVLGLSFFGGLIVFLVGRSMMRQQSAGVDEMIGLVGQASTALAPEGKIFIRGEYWNVESDQSIEPGEPVEVVAVDGLTLRVRRASESR